MTFNNSAMRKINHNFILNQEKSMKNFALLIDGENVSGKNLKFILDTLRTKGEIQEKIVFADFDNKSHSESWNQAVKDCPIQMRKVLPIGKDATDSELLISALEFLYEKPQIDAFCLVSSDSGFSTLARHLRGKDKFVLGMGREAISNKDWQESCSDFEFLPTENKHIDEEELAKQKRKLELIFTRVFNKNSPQGQPILLADFGRMLKNDQPDFTMEDYYFSNLTEALKNIRWFKLDLDTSDKQAHLVHKSHMQQQDFSTKIENSQNMEKYKAEALKVLELVFDTNSPNGKSITMAMFGDFLKKQFPSFRYKDYGYPTLVAAFKDFDSEFVLTSDGNKKQPNYTIHKTSNLTIGDILRLQSL